MILAGVFRLCTYIADYFAGEPGRPIGASLALAGSPGRRITQYRFCEARSLTSPVSEWRPLVCSTQGITPRPWINGLVHWGG